MQWIVTTHSPLVLSSFDRHELTWLQPNNEPKEVDRQIIGFSPDQIYRFLMETEPESMIMEHYQRFQLALRNGEEPDAEDVVPSEVAAELAMQGLIPG